MFSDNVLKVVNICLMIFCFLDFIRKEEKVIEKVEKVVDKAEKIVDKAEKKVEEEEEEKDINKWYPIYDGKILYKGEWKNGLPNGKGIKEYLERGESVHTFIECNFVDGKAEGYGKQTYDKTEDFEEVAPYYEGGFKNNKHHGYGAYYWGDGDYLIGHYENGECNGFGIFYSKKRNMIWSGIYENGHKKTGEWFQATEKK